MSMRSIKQFKKATFGGAAVEFAIIAPVFFALTFSLIEAGWLMTKIALVDNAVQAVSRDIYRGSAFRTAQRGEGPVTSDRLKERICSRVPIVADCENNIELEVTTLTDFTDIPADGAVCRDSFSEDQQPVATYNPGGSSEISLVRACVTTDILVPGLGVSLALPKNEQGRYEIVSLLAFVNEPF